MVSTYMADNLAEPSMNLDSGAPETDRAGQSRVSAGYAWYVLGVLALVNLYNTMDRYSLSILAEDVRHSFALADSQLGFLTGTAFAIFYALFGYPVARLADRWNRVKLLAIAVALWSSMTLLSALAGSLTQLSVFRLGLGMGEAAVGPVGYSLISDWFPRTKRATANGFFGATIYIGAGLALFIGGLIVTQWHLAYPGPKPFGLQGWQVTFLAFGLPGLLLAGWVATLREPTRGLADGVSQAVEGDVWHRFFKDVSAVLPPLTLYDAALRGRRSLAANVGAAIVAAVAAGVMILVTRDWLQWSAIGFGWYAAFSAAMSLRHGDRVTFDSTWGSKTFMLAAVGFGSATTVTTLMTIWAAPLAIRNFGMASSSVGLILGAITAIGGGIGAILGGRLSDLLLKRTPLARIWVGIGSMLIPLPFTIVMCLTHDRSVFFLCFLPAAIIGKAWIAPGAATIQDLVDPRMRGTANNAYFLLATFVSAGLAPYTVGKFSEITGSLGIGLCITLTTIVLLAALCMSLCGRRIAGPLAIG